MEAQAEPTRDRYGRPLIIPATGGKPKPYTRPTTIADTLDDRHNLELWKMRQVTLGLLARPDLSARAATTDPTDKSTLNGIASEALEAAGSSAAANLGTAIHAAVEQVNRGYEPPAMFADTVAVYRATLERHGVEVDADHVEQFCVNEPIGSAGTFDMRVRIGDDWYIADLKTGSTVEWSGQSFAVQLAIYAGATTYYDCATDTHSDPEPVDQDRALIVHLPAGGETCTLHWLDIAAGREALYHALWVRRWRGQRGLLTTLERPDDESEGSRLLPRKSTSKRADAIVQTAGDDSQLVDLELVTALRQRATASPNAALIKQWVAEGDSAGAAWSMNGGNHDKRRYAISAAAVAVADSDAEWTRAVLALVVGDDARKPSVPVGAILGALTLAEAERVVQIAETATAYYDDDGILVVTEDQT